MKPLHLLKAGTFTDAHGQRVTLTVGDLSAIAAAYDPVRHEAPIVVGHPAMDAPAYGWIDSLSADAESLRGTAHQVNPVFAEAVRAGAYKKISVSLYGPRHPNNPTPDSWHLRHVGFLGGQTPAVKGLPNVELAEDDTAVTLEFELGEADDATRRASDLAAAAPIPLSEHEDPDMDKTTELAEREAALAERERKAQAKEAELAQAEAQARRQDAAAFTEALVKDRKVLPRDQAAMTELLSVLPDAATVAFAEGDSDVRREGAASAFLRQFLSRLPVQVDLGERTGAETAPAAAPILVPAGYTVDPASLALHQQAVAFAEAHDVSYDEAVSIVAQTRPESSHAA